MSGSKFKNYEVGLQDEKLIVFISGEATHVEAPSVQKAVESYVRKAASDELSLFDICMHLGEASYMDSTFMGVLLMLNRLAERELGLKIQMINPSAFCRNLLESSGVDQVIPVESSVPIDGIDRWPLDVLEINQLSKAHLLLDAHNELSHVTKNKSTQRQFSLVRRLLEEDIKKQKENIQKEDSAQEKLKASTELV